jgi:AcrR family transcriptional regulator
MGIHERKERERLQRRNNIIDAAERLFFKHGFDRVSIDQIAEAAELAKGTIYLYFKSREDLHYAIVNRGLDAMAKVITERYDPSRSGAENLLEMGRSYIRFTKMHPGYNRALMVFDASKFEKVDQKESLKILDPGSPLRHLIDVVTRGQEDGSIRKDISPAVLGILMWANLSSVLEFVTLRKPVMEKLSLQEEELLSTQFEVALHGILSNTRNL